MNRSCSQNTFGSSVTQWNNGRDRTVSTMYCMYDLEASTDVLLVARMMRSRDANTMVHPNLRSSATSCKKALHIILCTMRCRSGSYNAAEGLHSHR